MSTDRKVPSVRTFRAGQAQSTSKVAATLATALITGLALVGCGNSSDADSEAASSSESAAASETEDSGFTAEDVDPVTYEELDEPMHDPGLNVDFHFQGTDYGDYGGTRITVAVENLNDVALPPDAIETPTLSYNAGDDNTETADLLETSVPEGVELQRPLDLPLGSGAIANLHYTFDVSRANLWDAEFQIGNVIMEGDLIA